MPSFSCHCLGPLVIIKDNLFILTDLLFECLHPLLQELILGNQIIYLLAVIDICANEVVVPLDLHSVLEVRNLSLIHLCILPQTVELLVFLSNLLHHVLPLNANCLYLYLLYLLLLLTSLLIA